MSLSDNSSQIKARFKDTLEHTLPPSNRDEAWRYSKIETFGGMDKVVKIASRIPSIKVNSSKGRISNSLDEEILTHLEVEAIIGGGENILGSGVSSPISSQYLENLVAYHALENPTTAVRTIALLEDSLGESNVVEIEGEGSALLVVSIPEGVKASLSIKIGSSGMLLPRFSFHIRRGAKLSILIEGAPINEVIGLARFYLGTQAEIDLVLQGALAKESVGGGNHRFDTEIVLAESRSRARVTGVMRLTGRDQVSWHTSQIHLAPNCHSDLSCRAVVDGSARSIYSGYIKVSPKAHQTDAYQKSSNLLLSKRGRVDAIPNLEIKANDVKCSHGASVKKIGEEELFYCESRGIPPNECKQLLTDGFLREAYGRIERKAVFQPLLDILNPQAFENE